MQKRTNAKVEMEASEATTRPRVMRDAHGRLLPGSALAAGHGPRTHRLDMQRLLTETADTEKILAGFNALWDLFAAGERWAVELILAYTIGRPVQRSVSAHAELTDLLRSWHANDAPSSSDSTDYADKDVQGGDLGDN